MRRETPSWVWAVWLCLAVQGVWAPWPRSSDAEWRARAARFAAESATGTAGGLDPRRMSARELRQLPGVGATLALALARTRDAHRGASALAWEDVPGIGVVRARDIRAWFRARGIEPDPLALGVPGASPGYPPEMRALARLATGALFGFAGACGGAEREGPAEEATAPVHPEAPAEPSEARARTLTLAGGNLHALEAGPSGGAPVLLLHGARFSARTWEDLGTLARLAEAGYHAFALDWPGHGASPDWGQEDAGTLLASVCDQLGSGPVALVAPSMGGGFALEFLAQHPSRARAFVGIAPAGARDFAPEHWSLPTLFLWGVRDEIVPLADGRALATRLAARLEVLPEAAHACYLDQPERFHALLLEFLAEARAEDAGR